MIRISITQAAFDAICATLPLGSVGEMVALRAQGKPLRAISEAVAAKGHRLSHEGVAGVLRAAGV